MMVSTMMFVIFALEFAILALVFAIFALLVVFALTKMFDLAVVLLYFTPFDSQQRVFYWQRPAGRTLDHSFFILIRTKKY